MSSSSESANLSTTIVRLEVVKKSFDVYQHKDRKNRRCVVFVHGLTGDMVDTWKKDKQSSNGFVELLLGDDDLLDYDIGTFGYRSTYLHGSPIINAAIQLKYALSNLPDDRYDAVVLIAHSMGGLVCMRYIVDALKKAPPQPPVAGLLLYGTPTTGSDMINIAKLIGFGIGIKVPPIRFCVNLLLRSQRQIADLATGSKFLSDLHEEWAYRVVNGGHEEAGKGRMWLTVGVVTGDDDKFVKEASGKGLYGAIDWLPLSYGHIALVKPEERNDPRYLRAKRFLKVCRTHDNLIFDQVWSASQDIWKSRTARVSEKLEFTTVIHDERSMASQFKDLPSSRFAGCETYCAYDVILESDQVEFGLSIGDNSIWDRGNQPIYAHQIGLNLLPLSERSEFRSFIDALLALPESDERVWLRLFPKLDLSVDGISLSPEEVVTQIPRTVANWMCRKYRLPRGFEKKVGTKVRLDLDYRSVVPLPLQNFLFSAPWVINRVNTMRVIVHGEFDYFVPTHRIVPMARAIQEESVLSDRREVKFSYKGVMLPGSTMEVQWRRRTRKEIPA